MFDMSLLLRQHKCQELHGCGHAGWNRRFVANWSVWIFQNVQSDWSASARGAPGRVL